ncbi:hypothetical protein [Wolbachia endosymbiont of Tetranychus urticae]|uniref:hypothetical protein n=1 Tax=Wolbachia endosymbiont of Tetranychus urticae TaxID=169184 RepID=UPI00397BCF9F
MEFGITYFSMAFFPLFSIRCLYSGNWYKISEFLFNIKGKVAKQHAEPIIEKNLYTILGFKDVEDLEHKTSKSVNKKIWQSFVDCFAKEIDYAATKQVVKNVVCNIAKVPKAMLLLKLKA